ncbi:unnamed protein product [Moneuplotes crassus]|uniref:Uncharacterized protein n=1 Tax=Euplotes crassus TaxID=5936 RepID=A0AAD1XVC6_EUPCR|nr:unnamed protein product [Moneuplotes crassus]
MLFLAVWVQEICTTTCPNTTLAAQQVETYKFTMSGYSRAEITKVVRDESSGNIYYYGRVYNTERSLFMKYDENNTQIWRKVYQNIPCSYAFCVTSDETYTYSLSFSTNRLKIFQQNATDGQISGGKETTAYFTTDESKITTSLTDETVYISVLEVGTNDPAVCRWTITSADLQCVIYPGHNIAKEIIGYDSSQLIFVIDDTNAAKNLKIKKIDFDNIADVTVWDRKIECPTASCSAAGLSAGNTNDTTTKIAMSFNNQVILTVFNVTDGAFVGNRSIFNDTGAGCTGVNSISKTGTGLFFVLKCTKQYMMHYYYNAESWGTPFEIVDSSITFNSVANAGQFYYLTGGIDISGDLHGYINKGPSNSMAAFTSISSASTYPSQLDNVTYPVVTDTATVVSSTNTTMSHTTLFTEDLSATYTPEASSSITDESFWLNTFGSDIDSGATKVFNISLTCSVGGSTPMTHTVVQYSSQALPPSVSLDDSTYQLTMSSDSFTSAHTYRFVIETVIGATTYTKTVRISVNIPVVTTNPTSTTNSSSSGEPAANETETPQAVSMTKTVTQTAVGGGIALGAISGALSSSSPHNLWTLMNQFQMFLLLNLLGANLHQYIKDYLAGFEFANFNLEFFSIQNIHFVNDFFQFFSCKESNEDYELVGFNYKCTLLNNFQLFLIFIPLVFSHIFINIMDKRYEGKNTFLGRLFMKLYQLWNFAIYFRIILEAYLFLYFSSLNEIYIFDVSREVKGLSFAISFCVLLGLLALVMFIFWVSFKASDPKFIVEISKCSELFLGTKQGIYARLFQFVFILRRILSASWIVFSNRLVIEARICVFLIIQVFSFGYVVVIRPFDGVKENIIEALHDGIYCCVCVFLIHYNSSSRWTDSAGTTVVTVLTVNGILILIIQIIAIILTCMLKCKPKKREQVNSRVAPCKVSDNSRLDSIQEFNMKKGSSANTLVISNDQKDMKDCSSINSQGVSRIDNYMRELQDEMPGLEIEESKEIQSKE